MSIRKFEIEADIPDGYEPNGEFRRPNPGEWFITSSGDVMNSRAGSSPPRLILRPEWKWPEWIKPGTWIAMDESGEWYAYEHEPEKHNGRMWICEEGECDCLSLKVIEFSPPPLTDWRNSKRQKPA